MHAAIPRSSSPRHSPLRALSIVLKWTARVAAVGLAALGGVFFLEHLVEWFGPSQTQWPPARVWVAMAFHAALLVGLCVMLRWTLTGAAIAGLGTLGFVIAAGIPVSRAWPIVLVGLAPSIIGLCAAIVGRIARRSPA